MNVDSTIQGPTPRTSRAGRTFDAIPAPALVLLGIVSVQLGSAVAKQLFGEVGSFGTVALRLFFASVVLLVLSPVIDRLLRLDSLPTAALVAIASIPFTVMGGQAGILQG